MTKTYRIRSPVGDEARWQASLNAAKERYIASTTEAYRDDDEPMPVIAFEQSTEDDMGNPRSEYTRCLLDGSWDSSIFEERPAWPTWELGHGASPDLAMKLPLPVAGCWHGRLICSNTCTPRDGVPEPRIRCAECGATWEPER